VQHPIAEKSVAGRLLAGRTSYLSFPPSNLSLPADLVVSPSSHVASDRLPSCRSAAAAAAATAVSAAAVSSHQLCCVTLNVVVNCHAGKESEPRHSCRLAVDHMPADCQVSQECATPAKNRTHTAEYLFLHHDYCFGARCRNIGCGQRTNYSTDPSFYSCIC
jgi:hypothetical protein